MYEKLKVTRKSLTLTIFFLLTLNKVHEINCSSFEYEQAGIGTIGRVLTAREASKCMAASVVFSKMAQMLSLEF